MAKVALVELVCLMDNKTNRVKISHERLSQRMGCSKRTAIRAIETLVELGVVNREQTKYSANRYTVQMDGPMTDWDEWETLGEDTVKKKPAPPSGRLSRLVDFFSSEVEIKNPMAIQSQVNGKALSKHFKEMMDTHGVTEQQIKKMVTLFSLDIRSGKKKIKDMPAWRAFLADRQALLRRVVESSVDVIYIDDGRPADD